VIAIFNETKIPTVHMKVLVYSDFSKKIRKNEIAKIHEEWKIIPFKCRGKVQKTREETLKGLFSNFLNLTTHLFGLVWSTLVGWLHHMPALPKFLLKFSNIHYFGSVGPQIMKFILPQSLFQGACSQKVSKNLKIKWDQVMLPKTGLSAIPTFGPLGVILRRQCYKLNFE
jgi:hypothetical protein